MVTLCWAWWKLFNTNYYIDSSQENVCMLSASSVHTTRRGNSPYVWWHVSNAFKRQCLKHWAFILLTRLWGSWVIFLASTRLAYASVVSHELKTASGKMALLSSFGLTHMFGVNWQLAKLWCSWLSQLGSPSAGLMLQEARTGLFLYAHRLILFLSDGVLGAIPIFWMPSHKFWVYWAHQLP